MVQLISRLASGIAKNASNGQRLRSSAAKSKVNRLPGSNRPQPTKKTSSSSGVKGKAEEEGEVYKPRLAAYQVQKLEMPSVIDITSPSSPTDRIEPLRLPSNSKLSAEVKDQKNEKSVRLDKSKDMNNDNRSSRAKMWEETYRDVKTLKSSQFEQIEAEDSVEANRLPELRDRPEPAKLTQTSNSNNPFLAQSVESPSQPMYSAANQTPRYPKSNQVTYNPFRHN